MLFTLCRMMWTGLKEKLKDQNLLDVFLAMISNKEEI